MKLISEVFKWFLYITTGVLIVTATMYTIMGETTMPVNTLWKILAAGLLTTAVTVCFKPWKEWTPWGFLVHFLALCVVMVICGSMFGWIEFNWQGILFMTFDVAIVYAIAFGAYLLVDLRQAKEINERLKEKYKD